MTKVQMTSYQPSLTEWFAAIDKQADSILLRAEDNSRAERFKLLHETINFPGDLPLAVFSAGALKNCDPSFRELLATRGDQLAAIRLIPQQAGLPKLRHRGPPLKECYEDWFLKQNIPHHLYNAEIYRHVEPKVWSATFVISKEALFGEIIPGTHTQLTHGETASQPIQFKFDYNTWQWSEINPEAQQVIERMIGHAQVEDAGKQTQLSEKLDIEFFNNYIGGYFECFVDGKDELEFVDYNRVLPRYIAPPTIVEKSITKSEQLVTGAVAFSGKVRGVVKVVEIAQFDSSLFSHGDILVCDNTDVRFVPLMQKAGAIITNRGGILSHAAIVARELKKPCIIGTKIATKILKDGDIVEVDADHGIVRKYNE